MRQRLFGSQRLAVSRSQFAKIHGPWPNCRGFPWEARQRDFITAYSSIMAGFCESRIMNHGLSRGFRCGVPPRQTQTNNDASGSPQRVAGRPPEYPPGRPLRNRIQAIGMKTRSQIAKKYAANGHVRRGRPLTSQTAFGGQLPYKGSLVRPAAIFDHSPFGFDGMFFDYE